MDSKTLYHSFSAFNFIKQKGWFEMFSRFIRNQRQNFLFLHISLAIHRNFRNWHQIYNQFNFSTGNLPPKFDSFLSVNDSIHSYNTRHASFFWLPLCRTNIRQFSISFQGCKFFNTLSYEIKNTPTLMSFKLKLKDFNQQL